MLHAKKTFVLILYRGPAFEAFDDFRKAIILTSRQSLTGCAKGLSAFTLNVLLRQGWPGGTNFFLSPKQLRRARRTLCREGDFPGRDGWFRAPRRPARFFADNEGGAGTPPSWP
jgi:hypothetical protein